MSYTDTTLAPATGYTYVNFKQVYDQIALQLASHPAWSFVESVDYVAGAVTYRTFVWKCLATKSGLPKDFHVGLRYGFNTATGVVSTHPGTTERGLRPFLFEDYNTSTKTATNIAPYPGAGTVVTADKSSDRSLVLNTVNVESTIAAYFHIGMKSLTTSYRVIVGVTNSVLYVIAGTDSTYVGKFESILTAAEDPMPILIGGTDTNYSSSATGGSIANRATSTRHPLIETGVQQYSFQLSGGSFHGSNSSIFSGQWLYPTHISTAGVLGDPSNVGYSLYLKGVLTSKCSISTSGVSSSTVNGFNRGGFRGFLLHMVVATTAVHSPGDTFEVGGKSYVGPGSTNITSNGLWDITA